MPAASLSQVKNPHYAERAVWASQEFLDTVEAAVRSVAFEVHQEPKTTPGHDQRSQVALNIATSSTGEGTEAKRFRNIFVTVILENATLEGQLFDRTSPTSTTMTIESRVKPWQMDGALLRQVIKQAWNAAANVQPETQAG